MDEYGQMPRKHRRAGALQKLLMVGVLIVIILIAVFAYFFLGGPTNISGPTTLAISGQGAVFAVSGINYVATLAGYNNNTKTAYVYVSRVPVFMEPVLNVTLAQNSTVKVNYGGQYAIMQFKLVSGGANSASVQIAPLAASLQIDPDYQYIGHPAVSLPGIHVTASTTAPTTTIATGSSTAPTTTVGATTTVQTSNYTASAISAAIKPDQNYGLVLNFTKLYNQTSSCTQSNYKLAYFDLNGAFPQVPADFANVSNETPYGMAHRTVSKGGNAYAFEFLALSHDPAFNGSVALEIDVTVTSPGTNSAIGMVTADKYGGIFAGTTYSTLSAQYTQTKALNNSCAAMVG